MKATYLKTIVFSLFILQNLFAKAHIHVNENQKFVQLFDVLTTIGETERELDQMTDSEKLIIEMIANSGAQVSIQAQALLAELSNTQYIRFPEMIPSSSAMIISSNEVIEAQEKAMNITVYPNPSESDVVVKFDEAKEATGYVVDAIGRIVITLLFDGKSNNYSINNLAEGIYTLSIRYNDGTNESQRIIIK